ncbi:hypothetical protein KEJ21_03290 [Candidatus Bathyarchaeota archaeon]|nr:hypothetical protein [Candidatus Bathyarchaeota archaeon]MBS7630291.1 hypothetical protein [Candidatus Bathyarchaeota archaeon]
MSCIVLQHVYMLKIMIFTDNPSVNETQLVIKEARSRGIETRVKAPWDIVMLEHEKLSVDLVYVPSNMLNRGSTFELIHRLLMLKELEDQASIVINSIESMLLYSKEHLSIQMEKLNLPTPKTIITENIEYAYNFAAELLDSGKEVVLKPLCRGRGIGVTMLSGIRSRGDLLQFLTWYNRSFAEGVFYLQEFKPNLGYDIRCFVIGEKVVGREKRSNPNDFRYNVSAGGQASPFEDDIYDELAVKVTKAMGFKITGIDILPGKDGKPYVLEANCFPGYTALIEATGIPIHKKIIDYFEEIIKK